MIYFVQDQESLLIKIGYTGGRLKDRLNELQPGCPGRLVVLQIIPGDRAFEDELHRRFAASHYRGEWFRPTAELLRFLVAWAQDLVRYVDRLHGALDDCLHRMTFDADILGTTPRETKMVRDILNRRDDAVLSGGSIVPWHQRRGEA